MCACVHACSRALAELEDEACNGYLQTCIAVVLSIYQQQQKGEEVEESAGSSMNESIRTSTGKSKLRANNEKKPKEQAEHVGRHTDQRTRSATTPWHASKMVPSVDTETEYINVMYSDAEGTELLAVKNSKPVFSTITDDSWKLVSAGPPKTKRSVAYVGNISPDCTENRLKQFIMDRSEQAMSGSSIPVHTCSVHVGESGRVSARVTVDATSMPIVTAPNFWPGPLYCRPWCFSKNSGGKPQQQRQQQQRQQQQRQQQQQQQQQQSPLLCRMGTLNPA